mmetsp:Transcript_22145/g.36645  ORF Transcript_22145/g.36645 Transcript_22145/m.36645 type:complete len:219 (-) Transcript_22145:1656-2312(-)
MNEQQVQVINTEWDDEGVYFYQAYNDEIADWALEYQTLGGPAFKPTRMTWIKPSFAWVLYRSGYGRKKNQERILKIKLGHDSLGQLLSCCTCGHGNGGTLGRVQWDPERDILTPGSKGEGPRKMVGTRAIQIGLSKSLSETYVASILQIEDVTDLASRIGEAHGTLAKNPEAGVMEELLFELPLERPYIPHVDQNVLLHLALVPSPIANAAAQLQQHS